MASLAAGTALQQLETAGVKDTGRSERHSQLSARLAGVPQRFQLLPGHLLLVFQDCMESFRGGALQIQIHLRILCYSAAAFYARVIALLEDCIFVLINA